MRYCPEIELPERPYRPGSGDRRPELDIPSSKPLVRAEFRDHRGLAAGIDMWNGGFFWEAHEVWEAGWKASAGTEREFLQGLIQLAAARLNNNARVADRAAGHLSQARSHGAIFCGIDLEALSFEADRIDWLTRGRDLPASGSDMIVQPPECQFADCEFGVLMTTRDRRDYYSGNTLFADAPIDPTDDAQVELWRKRLAELITHDALYHTVQWENEGVGPVYPPREDCQLDQFTALRANRITSPRDVADGFEIRRIATDSDWRAATELSIEINIDAFGPKVRGFTEWRYKAFRNTVARMDGFFLGAWTGDELAGCLGAVPFARGFRYQDVQVRAKFRRRGIASALCTAAFNQMTARGLNPGVIVADSDSPADVLYRGLGFEPVSTVGSLQFKAA